MAAGLLAFFIALFASLMLTVPVRALALRVGMVDLPGPRKVHLQPIPLLGGLAMYARPERRNRNGRDLGRCGRLP
jgi:UDP-N-acetylmuramyl pentapeptide phosphotransferase/UDP-N-acetylglucosamine-1-phosphate transferase